MLPILTGKPDGCIAFATTVTVSESLFVVSQKEFLYLYKTLHDS